MYLRKKSELVRLFNYVIFEKDHSLRQRLLDRGPKTLLLISKIETMNLSKRCTPQNFYQFTILFEL